MHMPSCRHVVHNHAEDPRFIAIATSKIKPNKFKRRQRTSECGGPGRKGERDERLGWKPSGRAGLKPSGQGRRIRARPRSNVRGSSFFGAAFARRLDKCNARRGYLERSEGMILTRSMQTDTEEELEKIKKWGGG